VICIKVILCHEMCAVWEGDLKEVVDMVEKYLIKKVMT
jgi:hypothetical protein